ncbi:uncharacterized protein PGTG_12430 [Puccinia graminis f. sp. tritici CRL 75-36-700-3]|uniref:Ribosomal protein L1 n=1 Tax=Puccinia graminis f. sp. tritici (strain CRL 75-36-700-3 / race SCCL) TaxID=418459 RepID=E3KQ99_PUCGT|nr:uncharacterized protein PGTG_12430 [Puccinia graminis f. sp. tritici CRL 75-36-700-3]EFP86474.1 hypothetical protein PGTG_12430 [Puccinia graminis f. sp. tritici CRL 75-36-700-3]
MGKKSLKRTSEALTEKPTTSPTPTPTTTTKTKKIKSSNTTTTTSSKKVEEDDEILTSKVPFIKRSQVEQAIKALIDHSNKSVEKNIEQGELFADQVGSNERFLNLVISLKRITPKPKHKPIKITLSHPLYDPRVSPVCLIVKDPQREYKDLLEEKKIHFISKVIGIEKLKGKHSSYEARRLLLNNHALFLADDRVIGVLPKLLGVKFFKTNKLPIAVDVTNKDGLKGELERTIGNTTLRIGGGSCLTIKVADLARHSSEQIKLNLVDVLGQLGKKIPLGGWNNIQAVHLKTGTSTSLPLWLAPLDDSENGRFNILHTTDEEARIQAALEKIEEKREKKKIKISNKLDKIVPV